ncbi:MAG: alpha/beta hydrolase [Deltaproteobacteria bacterium]|nr:alpha/beta hydrolase [Deltaproteobacteria bacterium]
MGATVLTIASAAFNVRPRAMILIEPIFLPEDFYRIELRVEDHPLASKSIRRKNYWEDRQEAAAYLKSRPLFKNWDDEMLDLYLRYGMSTGDTGGLQLVCSPQREASLFMGGMKFDPWPVLSKVNCPVLILEGELSENRSFIDLKKAASLFPRGAYRLVEGAGHLIPMEKPGEITDVIRSFFSTL